MGEANFYYFTCLKLNRIIVLLLSGSLNDTEINAKSFGNRRSQVWAHSRQLGSDDGNWRCKKFYECNRSCREEDFAPNTYSCAARIDAICSFAHTDASRVESGGQRDQNRR